MGSQREFQRAQFGRAIAERKLFMAWELATEMAEVSRAEALALVILLAEGQDKRFVRTADRWAELWIAEHGGVPVEDQLVRTALHALVGPTPTAGIEALREIFQHYGEDESAAALEGSSVLGSLDLSADWMR